MNLVTLSSEYQVLADMLEDSVGVLTPEIDAYMDAIGAHAVAGLFQLQDLREDAQMAAKAVKDKISDLKAKVDILERRDETLKKVQIKILETVGQKSMTNGVYKITLTQNPLKVEIVDPALVPSNFMLADIRLTQADLDRLPKDIVISAKLTPDKKAISDLYKAAEVEVAGCEYVRDANVRVS